MPFYKNKVKQLVGNILAYLILSAIGVCLCIIGMDKRDGYHAKILKVIPYLIVPFIGILILCFKSSTWLYILIECIVLEAATSYFIKKYDD